MTARSLFLGLLTGLCLLGREPMPSHAQNVSPLPQDGVQSGPMVSPLFEPARVPSPWYVDAEVALLFNTAIHVNQHFGAITDNNPVYVSPRAFLGYRFENGSSVRFTYRNLTEVGNLGQQYSSPTGYGSSQNTFTTNWFDLDYVSREFAPLDWWRLQWEAGGRFVFRYHDWRYQDPYWRSDSSFTFLGGGPHLGLTSHCLLGDSGWALYGRADTAVTFGEGTSDSRSRPLQVYPGGFVSSPYSHRNSTAQFQLDGNLQLGLIKRWQLQRCNVGLGLGAQAETLSMGNLEGGDFNLLGYVNVGPFLRCEVGF